VKLLKADTGTTQFLCDIPGGLSIKALYLKIKGTCSLTAVDPHDVGRVYLLGRTGNPLVAADFHWLQARQNIMGGNCALDVPAATNPYQWDCIIPRGYEGDGNVELTEDEDNLQFRIDLGPNMVNSDTDFQIRLYAILEDGVTRYQLTMIQQEFVISGAGTWSKSFHGENLNQVLVSDIVSEVLTLTGSGITFLTCSVGSRDTNAFITDLIGYTNNKYQLEAATAIATVIHQAEGDIVGSLDDDIDISFVTTGTAVPQVLLCGALMNPQKLALTAASMDAKMIAHIQRKQLAGRFRAVAMMKAIARR
jgi:hypothetical protein